MFQGTKQNQHLNLVFFSISRLSHQIWYTIMQMAVTTLH